MLGTMVTIESELIWWGLTVVLPGTVAAIWAKRKGYLAWLWFAPGLVGLLAVALLPFANRQGKPEEERRLWKRRGNFIGCLLTAVVLIVWAMPILS